MNILIIEPIEIINGIQRVLKKKKQKKRSFEIIEYQFF